MHILFMARDVSLGGGLGDSVHVGELVAAWTEADVKVTVAGLGDTDEMGDPAYGSISRTARIIPLLSRGIWRLYHPRQFLAVWRVLTGTRLGRFDVVYSRPSVGLTGTFDILPDLLLASFASVPLVLEINGWALDEAKVLRPARYLRHRALASMIERLLFPLASGFVAVSESLGKRVVRDFGVEPSRVRIIPLAADTSLFRPSDILHARSALGLPEKGRVISYVGHIGLEAQLAPVIQALLQLVPKYPDIQLLIVGDGADRPRYMALARRLGVESHVVFAGLVPHDHVPLYVNASEIGLVSIREDLLGMSMKLFEYWACGKPVVATKTPDLDFVKAIGGGLLAAPSSPDGWAKGISTLLDSEEMRIRMGSRGREYVLKERTWSGTAAKVLAFLRETAHPTQES